MEIVLRLEGPADEDDLLALRDWLTDDEELRRTADIGFGPDGAPKGMSGALLAEFIRVVSETDAALRAAHMVAVVYQWIKSRNRSEGVELSNSRGDVVLIKSDSAETIAQVAAILAVAGGPGQLPGGGVEGA
jgi:hypothetical protein